MKLYFKVNNNKTISIDTENKCFTLNGGFCVDSDECLKISEDVYRHLIAKCTQENYSVNWYR